MSPVERLLRLVAELDLPEDALDDAVYDCAISERLGEINSTEDEDEQDSFIGDGERAASNINNSGWEDQIEYLIKHNDETVVERLIRSCASCDH